MPKPIITTPCHNCHYKNGAECFSVLALSKTARAMESELYSHHVESLVSEFVIPCKNYVSEESEAQQTIKQIV